MAEQQKIEFLKGMGFTEVVKHRGRIRVYISANDNKWFEFDFSATWMKPEAILYTVIQEVWEEAYAKGHTDSQREIRGALGLDEWLGEKLEADRE